jgi:pyridoxine 4-dehydrogenase
MTNHTTNPSGNPLGGDFILGGDRPVRRLGFGTMRLPAGAFTGPPRDPETGIAVLRRAVELGVNHIDTADFYVRGDVAANDLVRRALAPYADDLVIATKVGPLLGPDGMPSRQAPPEGLRALVEKNLTELGLDRLDLVYLRIGGMSPDPAESLAARFEVLAGLREEGLIRHLGVSNVHAGQLTEAQAIAPVAAVQNHFHVHHTEGAEILRRCEETGAGFVPYFPLGGGDRPLEAERLARVAARHDATPSQVALASLLALSPVMLPIPGTGSLGHLEENVAAGALSLTEEDLAELAARDADAGFRRP